MSGREAFSWVWLTTMIVTYGIYFSIAPGLDLRPGIPPLVPFELLAATALVQVIIITIASIVIRMRDGPPSKMDERDRAIAHRAIAHRASSVSYYVLMTGLIVVGCIMPFSDHGWKVVNTAVFAIVIAEIVHHGLVVLGYRRGLHG